jgi:UDP-galactopyranose mutase
VLTSIRTLDPSLKFADHDILCLSHLRWRFVFQRPQHLLSRCARTHRVFFFEEPEFDTAVTYLEVTRDETGVFVIVPHLGPDAEADPDAAQRTLIDGLIAAHGLERYVLWYYTPMARHFTSHLTPAAIVYDCMDELSGFLGAPPGLLDAERALMGDADLVLTGGHSLYEAKRHLHPNIHPIPSSVDVAHFARARHPRVDPADQRNIAHPRIGFFGVLDERFDAALLGAVAARRPDWQFVLIGPVAKIDPASLPQRANIHYLGAKPYSALPDYLAGWSVALLPFARNASTRFISPTKTPEYLAAGKPVVSTSIRDVVRPYGEAGLARIADTPDAFIEAIAAALEESPERLAARADAFLSRTSWDATWEQVSRLMAEALIRRAAPAGVRTAASLPRLPQFATASPGSVA